jgi:hypothetical protein
MAKLNFKSLMRNPQLRARFIKDAGLKKAELDDYLEAEDMETPISYLTDDHEVFNYSTENGYCRIIGWQGYYFSGSEWDPLDGPFETLDKALDPLRYLLEVGDDIDTDSATHTVNSKLPDKDTFAIIERLIAVDDIVKVNDAEYRRTESGYVKEAKNS